MWSLRNQLQGNSPTFYIFRELEQAWDKLFEKMPIHFKSDFFAAVAVVDAKAPYYREYLRVLEALWWNKRNTETQTSM